MASAERGVSAGALITIVQPAARAGAIFRVIMALGKFLRVRLARYGRRMSYQGVIKPQTPTGCLITVLRVLGKGEGTVGPYVLRRSAKVLIMAKGRVVSPHSLCGKPAHKTGTVRNLALGLGKRLAILRGKDQGQVIGILLHCLKQFEEVALTLVRRQLCPEGESRFRCHLNASALFSRGCLRAHDCFLDLAAGHVGHLPKLLARCRVGHRERQSVGRIDPLTIDKAFGTEQRRIGQLALIRVTYQLCVAVPRKRLTARSCVRVVVTILLWLLGM
jgi:hypothetical protein